MWHHFRNILAEMSWKPWWRRVMIGSSCALCRLRLPGSKGYFLWLQRMRTPCSLMILKKLLLGNLDLSRPSSPTSRQPAQLCPLVDRAAAAEGRQRAAAPHCDLCKSGNISAYAYLFATCLWINQNVFSSFQMFLGQEENQLSGFQMFLHSQITFAKNLSRLELKVL